MRSINSIIYRYLTNADFFNINKPRLTEGGGGGQSYIDFPISDVSVLQWRDFFRGVPGSVETTASNRPVWNFPICSVGVSSTSEQKLKIYQRRAASVSVTAQKIYSHRSNRVAAWHPTYGFPFPSNPADRHQLPTGLAVYLVRANEDDIWAGWFLRGNKKHPGGTDPKVLHYLDEMFSATRNEGDAGILYCLGNRIRLNTSNPIITFVPGGSLSSAETASTIKPAVSKKKTSKKKVTKKKVAAKKAYKQSTRTEEQITISLFSEDSDYENCGDEAVIKIVTIVRKRNQKAVNDLKDLYEHKCQVTGTKYLFKKKNGVNYTEAHHLIPLGEGGADNPLNMVVLSPFIHRMFHYAKVSKLDLSKIKTNPDGSASLRIVINSKDFLISWKKTHYQKIMAQM